MKYSQLLGCLFCILLTVFSFTPWVYIASINAHITGMHTDGTNFGKPAIIHLFFAALCFMFFAVPKLWAKRVNLFFAALNVAWSIRNYFIVSACFAGECPVKLWGLYASMACSLLILVMSTLPKLDK